MMKKQIILKWFRRPLRLIPACFKNARMGEAFSIGKTVEFTDSCRYKLPDKDRLSWNRLFGVSRGDSGCFAWRYDIQSGMIEIGIDTRISRDRDISFVKRVPINKKLDFRISRRNNYLEYYINGVLIGDSWIGYGPEFLWGLGLRFGSTRRAPHAIVIEQEDYC